MTEMTVVTEVTETLWHYPPPPGEEAAPAVLVVRAVWPKVTPELLDLTLSLAICLGMVSREQADCHPKELKEGFPYTWRELGTPVWNYVFGQTVFPEHMVE